MNCEDETCGVQLSSADVGLFGTGAPCWLLFLKHVILMCSIQHPGMDSRCMARTCTCAALSVVFQGAWCMGSVCLELPFQWYMPLLLLDAEEDDRHLRL